MTAETPDVEATTYVDPIIELYKQDVDRTLLLENLKRTPEERIRNLMALQAFAEELRRAGREAARDTGRDAERQA